MASLRPSILSSHALSACSTVYVPMCLYTRLTDRLTVARAHGSCVKVDEFRAYWVQEVFGVKCLGFLDSGFEVWVSGCCWVAIGLDATRVLGYWPRVSAFRLQA